MAWCEENGVDDIFGLMGNAARPNRCRQGPRLRAEFDDAASSWNRQRQVVARLEVTSHHGRAGVLKSTTKNCPERAGQECANVPLNGPVAASYHDWLLPQLRYRVDDCFVFGR